MHFQPVTGRLQMLIFVMVDVMQPILEVCYMVDSGSASACR